MNFSQVKAFRVPEGDVRRIDINGFTVWQRLPNEYQEVEWIGTQGVQYINTGLDCSSLDYTITTESKSEDGISTAWGWCHNNVVNGTWIGVLQKKAFYKNWNYYQSITTSTQKRTICYDMTKGVYENGELTKSFATSIGSDSISNNPLILFCYYDFYDGGIKIGSKNEVETYSVKIFKSGVLVRDFVPCYRISNLEVGMYDLVGGVFYENQGTGEFSKGADV